MESQNLQLQKRRYFQLLIIACFFSLPFFWLGAGKIFGYSATIPAEWQLLLASIVQFIPGFIFYKASFDAIKAKKMTLDLLITLCISAGYGLSLATYLGLSSTSNLYFENTALIIFLVLLGRWIELQYSPNSRALSQKMTNKISSFFIPLILIISLLTFIGWGFYDSWIVGIIHAVEVLIIACPYAMVFAVPLVIIMHEKLSRDVLDNENRVAASKRKINQNLFFALFYNILGIPFAVLGILNPTIVTGAMAMSLISIVANSLMLKDSKAGSQK